VKNKKKNIISIYLQGEKHFKNHIKKQHCHNIKRAFNQA
jgi:hypothetical protein